MPCNSLPLGLLSIATLFQHNIALRCLKCNINFKLFNSGIYRVIKSFKFQGFRLNRINLNVPIKISLVQLKVWGIIPIEVLTSDQFAF